MLRRISLSVPGSLGVVLSSIVPNPEALGGRGAAVGRDRDGLMVVGRRWHTTDKLAAEEAFYEEAIKKGRAPRPRRAGGAATARILDEEHEEREGAMSTGDNSFEQGTADDVELDLNDSEEATGLAEDPYNPYNDEALMGTIDAICDDFFNCQPDVLRHFARIRGISASNKIQCISRIIDRACEETVTTGQLKYTRRVMGEDYAPTISSNTGVRGKWTDEALEASFLESACERHVRFQQMVNSNSAIRARRAARHGEAMMRSLIRPFLDSFTTTCDEAVRGVHRTFRAEVDELVRTMKPVEILSPFSTTVVSIIGSTINQHLIGRINVVRRLTDLGLFRAAVDEEGLLDGLMGLLEPISSDAERCSDIWKKNLSLYGKDTNETELACLQAFLRDNRCWDLDNVPAWAQDLATKFSNWEAVIRNDIREFECVPSIVFLAILQGVATLRVQRMVYGPDVRLELPAHIRGVFRAALIEHFNDEDKATSAQQALQHFVGAPTRENIAPNNDFFVRVDAQLQGALRERGGDNTDRLAVIMRQVGFAATSAERAGGLYYLLLQLTVEMQFHLRFQRVYARLSQRDRLNILRKVRSLPPMLHFFEKDMDITPISMKAACFLCIILLSMSFRAPAPGIPPKLRRHLSVTGRDEFCIIEMTDRDVGMTARDLNVALPPQLSYNSWLDKDDTNNNIYRSIPSQALKGATSNVMLLSQAPIIKALDCISRVPWRISRYMLYVQEAIVREGYGFGKIRPSFYPLNYTRRKSGEIVHEGLPRTLFNSELTKAFKRQRDLDWKRISELRSSRVHFLQALRQARALVQYSHLYFPNSLDFRGRMYPLPGRLNHTGSDPFRALLEYAEPKPLGRTGIYWLKVHLANKMGMTKLTFDERVRYVDEHIVDIVNSAEAPLTGDRWWQEGAEPLQALMACYELTEALKHSQGAENFPSRIPVAVDGSYNGLQHYSAIGRDEFGARLVNLIPSERPADAYTGILKEMLKSIEVDARNNMPVAIRCLGTGHGLDRNHIKRKTIKRPIMTQVYGVTDYGMQEQIYQELFKQNYQHGLWTRVDMKEMSRYLRGKVLESLGITFKETQECRKWLDQATMLIWRCQPNDLRNAFSWTTPLGLIVRQPYRARRESHLFTCSGVTRVSSQVVAPASRKQLTAIAPNLIHSLDATHLAMTALEMNNRDLDMMAVHDSFWTHACDLPVMSRILREQFVALYENYDPLYELKEQWSQQFFFDLRRHGLKLPDPPPRGTLTLEKVIDSPYFFS